MGQPDLRVPEETDCSTLAVKGELPLDLDGTLYRIGPDGSGNRTGGGQPYVSALRIRLGHAQWLRTRRVRTDAVCRQTGELPTPGPRRCTSDDTGSAVIRHNRRTLALGDGVLPYELTPDLRTKARCDFDGTLPFGFASRPIHDPLTGELFAAVPGPRVLWYVAVDVGGRVRTCEPIPVPGDPAQYTFALTERHALFPGPAGIGVMPREGTAADVVWAGAPEALARWTGSAGLPVNAFELPGGDIAVDVVRDMARDGDGATPGLWRRRVDTATGAVHEECLDDRAQDLPTIDQRYQGSDYRHAVTRLLAGDRRSGRGLICHDLADRTARQHDAEPGRLLGAPVFVPYSPTAPEGAGWVIVSAHNAARERDEVMILDTADFTGPPVAVVELPFTAPPEASACWLVADPW
jgi:carotenoid cleavage dioxygenase-like enzyme